MLLAVYQYCVQKTTNFSLKLFFFFLPIPQSYQITLFLGLSQSYTSIDCLIPLWDLLLSAFIVQCVCALLERIKSLLIDALLPDLSIWRAAAPLNADSQAGDAW